MKTPSLFNEKRYALANLASSTAILVVSALPICNAASVLTVNLGAAGGFAVLAGAGITIAAPANSSNITGDIGTFPTVSITGLENLILNGVNHNGDGLTQSAKTALMLAYTDAASRPANFNYIDGFNLSGTLLPGVHTGAGSLSVNGGLTLDAQGDPNAVWIFQLGSSLNVASAGQMTLINGASTSNIFWQVGSSATLASGSQLSGNILASQSITLNTGVTLNGRALASVGSVTMGGAHVAVPEPSSALLAGCAALGLMGRRARWK